MVDFGKHCISLGAVRKADLRGAAAQAGRRSIPIVAELRRSGRRAFSEEGGCDLKRLTLLDDRGDAQKCQSNGLGRHSLSMEAETL